MTTEALVAMVALTGVVIVITSLMSGWVERSNFPQTAVFLILGAVLGPAALNVMDVGIDTPVLRVVATLALALVLFTDAVTMEFKEIRKRIRPISLVLGPGTLVAAAATAALGRWILGLDWASAFVIGAAIASTDPIMLRGLLRRKDIPADARTALRLESGLNDIVLLPLLIIAMAFIPGHAEAASLPTLLLSLFVLGPGAGVAVGLIAVVFLRFARQTIGVRRDYESIYSLGVCFSAFAAAEAMHGSGFLAAFAAGAVIAALDDDLCDCFVEYGETTAEMLLMFTFVLLGGSLIWLGFGTLTLGVALFVVLALMARPVSLLLALAKEKLDPSSRSLITWFGPRGLSTLLLALIPAFEGVPGAERLFSICGLMVLLSIIVHGGSIGFLAKVKPAPYKSNLRMSVKPANETDILIEVPDIGAHMRLADVRSERSYTESSHDLEGAVRLNPERPVDGVRNHGFAPDDWIALFCT